MPSTSETTILIVLGAGLCFFGLSTLHISYHLPSPLPVPTSLHTNGSNGIRTDRTNSYVQNNIKTAHDDANAAHTSTSSIINKQHTIHSEKNIVGQVFLQQNKDTKLNICFPQSVYNEDWESINHPALQIVPGLMKNCQKGKENNILCNKIKVPKFWNPSFFKGDVRSFLGNYGERRMTFEESESIGSHIIPTKDYDNQKERIITEEEEGDGSEDYTVIEKTIVDAPPEPIEMLETVFVAISSYRDPKCPETLSKLFEQATYPERLRVAVVDQLDTKNEGSCTESDCADDPDSVLCKYSHLIEVFVMDAELAVGPVFARHIGNRMYRGEYFAMQIDAHMEFVIGWDVEVIEQWRSAKNEMAVLTTYVSDIAGHYNKTTGIRSKDTRPVICNSDFEDGYSKEEMAILMHGEQPSGLPEVVGEPTLQPFWAAGFSFSRGHFVVQVPYDQYLPMIFQGEEISLGLRGFTYGYDYYSPEQSVLFHYYNSGKKRKLKTYMEHAFKYGGVESASKARLLGITKLFPGETMHRKRAITTAGVESDRGVGKEKDGNGVHGKTVVEWNAIEEKKYGLGKVRTVKKFLDTFGIDLPSRTIQHHLCRFVGVPMNDMFTPHLRKDRMGIEYDKISFKFLDPVNYGKTWESHHKE